MASNFLDLKNLAANNILGITTGLENKGMLEKSQRYTPDEANETFDAIRAMPEYQAQAQEIGGIEKALNDLKAQPRATERPWVKPLLALADSQTGSNLLSGYIDPETNKKRDETILKYQDALANRRKQAADTLISGLGKFKSGSSVYSEAIKDPAQDLDKAANDAAAKAAAIEKANADRLSKEEQAREEANLKKMIAEQQDAIKRLEEAGRNSRNTENNASREKVAGMNIAAKGKGKAKETWTPMERARDTAFGKDVDSYLGGGRSKAEETLAGIDAVISDLQTGKLGSGFLESGFGLNQYATEAGRRAKNVADSLSMENMRATFGAQFTKSEGDLLRQANLDLMSGKKQNIANLNKAKKMIADKIAEMDNKISYVEGAGRGSLKGYQSLSPSAPVKVPVGNKPRRQF